MAIEFKLIVDPNPTVYKTFTIASQAYAIGDAVMLSTTAGTVIPATSSSKPVQMVGVAMEVQASSGTTLLVALITDQQLWSVDSANAVNSAHNMQRMVLIDKGTVSNTGTDSTNAAAVFRQEGILTGQRIVGRFLSTASA